MNHYRKRLEDIERRKELRLKTPVVFVVVTENGDYVYEGITYSKEQYDKLMKRIESNTIVLDDTRVSGISRECLLESL